MEFTKQGNPNKIQNHFSKKFTKWLFKAGLCLTLLLSFAGKSFAGNDEPTAYAKAEEYASYGLNDLFHDKNGSLYSCSGYLFNELWNNFHDAIVRLNSHTAVGNNKLFEEFMNGREVYDRYGAPYTTVGVNQAFGYFPCGNNKEQAIADLQHLFSWMVFKYFMFSTDYENPPQTPSPIKDDQNPEASFTRVDSVVQPSVTRVDSVFHPSVTRVDSVVRPSVTRVDSVVQPSVTRTGNVFQPTSSVFRVGRVGANNSPQASVTDANIPTVPGEGEEIIDGMLVRCCHSWTCYGELPWCSDVWY